MFDVPGCTITASPDDQERWKSIRVKTKGGTVELHVPAEVTFTQPLRVRWQWPECGERTAVIIHVGGGARVVIVEELVSEEDGSTWRHDAEVVLADGADVTVVSINRVRSAISLEMTQKSRLGDSATIRWKNVTLAAGAVDHDLQSELTGSDAVSAIDWMFYAKGDEKYQLTARNVFTGRHGGGEITMKGVAEERGHVRCDGMIDIGRGGNQTDTYLTQDVLMLDKTAKVDAIPRLEIKTNDVRASHSATVSRVTDEDLFYFSARGIIEREARKMFVEGFLGEMVGKIGDGTVREEILASVESKYGV